MDKPTINSFDTLGQLIIQQYESYLPNAFDDSMSLLQKVNKIIQYLNTTGTLVNNVVTQWNSVMSWITTNGVDDSVSARLETLSTDGTLASLINQDLLTNINNDYQTISINQGDITQLNTIDKSSVVNAIKEIKSQANTNQSTIASIGNASPKGVYTNLSALQSAFPNGNSGIYVCTADGNWYYWNGSAWTSGGTYQSSSIAQGSITQDKVFLFEVTVISKRLINVDLNKMQISIGQNCYLSLNGATYNLSPSPVTITIPNDQNTNSYILTFDTATSSVNLKAHNTTFTTTEKFIAYIYNFGVQGKNFNVITVVTTTSSIPTLSTVKNTILNSLLNPFIEKVHVKCIGDSITAGVGSTGYGLTNTAIGTTGYFLPLTTSNGWANLLKSTIEALGNKLHMIEPNHPNFKYSSTMNLVHDNSAKLRLYSWFVGVGNTMTFTYTGTHCNLYFLRDTGCGIVNITQDGISNQVDLYNASVLYGWKYTTPTVSYGVHTVTINITGANASAVSNRVKLEAVELDRDIVVKNWGISGIDVEWLYSNMSQMVESDDTHYLIQIGTNDRDDFNYLINLTAHLKAVIDYFLSQGKQVILLSANQLDASSDSGNLLLMEDIDMAISRTASDYGVDYISNYDYILKYLDYTGVDIDTILVDGKHPNDKGYKLMFKSVARGLGIPIPRSQY